MKNNNTEYYQDVEKCVNDVIEKVGKDIVFGMPLGLGKPNQLVNALYNRAKNDSSINLTILTALSLEIPSWKSELERRFLEPFVDRVFGDFVEFNYLKDLRTNSLPPNIVVKELFIKPGAYLKIPHAQQHYISSNYTHIARDTLEQGLNVVSQVMCKKVIDNKTMYSMSCNPDTALDSAAMLREKEKQGEKIAIIGMVNNNLPFMYGDAVVGPEAYDMIIDNPAYEIKLFGTPKMAMSIQDYMIGLNASALIKDGGTLQIGIGSLGDAIVYGLKLRQENNEIYKKILHETNIIKNSGDFIEKVGGIDKFEEGIAGSTEMLVDGYLELLSAGVIKRKTYNSIPIQKLVNEGKLKEDIEPGVIESLIEIGAIRERLTQENFDFLKEYGILKDEVEFDDNCIKCGSLEIPSDLGISQNLNQVVDNCLGKKLKKGILIHAGFFLGPTIFYDRLHQMSEEERKLIHMTSVLNVNHLYSDRFSNYDLKVLQRKHGRFCNAALMCSLSGAITSDGLENNQVVSGVGGQYNFVSMAHALPGGRSILMLRASRSKGADVSSNIVWNYGHTTIPRHLRDVVITEYGIASLRGKCDMDIMKSLINIADSRFQDHLLEKAKSEMKIPHDYKIPDRFRSNFPERLKNETQSYKKEGLFGSYPFGCDFTQEELVLGRALKKLKELTTESFGKASSFGKAMTIFTVPQKSKPYLKRLHLDNPSSAKEIMMQKMVIYALSVGGYI